MNRLAARHKAPRRAAVTAMVIAVMVITAGMMAEFVRRAVTDRRQTRQDVAYQQTLQLAQAGVMRTVQRLSNSTDYEGETWSVSAGVIHPTHTAQVTITMRKDSAVVVARYPFNSSTPNQITRTIPLSEQAQQ